MSVIFVDDEPQVLRGLERMLDAAEVEWESEFASSGDEALDLMEQEHFDAIVTDMRMPGMDGAELLAEVSVRHPDMIRVVLSGQADKETVLRAVHPMHQYLSKPCSAEVLRCTLSRACALRDVLKSNSLMELIGGLPSLPSIPSIYNKLITELRSENTSLDQVGEILSQDTAMAAKILQLANSSVFGLREPVTSPSRAASLVGIETIKALVLSVGVFKQFEGVTLREFSIEKMMDRCLDIAHIAKRIARQEGLESEHANDAFTAGLLHEVGKLVLISTDPKKYSEALKFSRENECVIGEAERETFGADYSAVGAYLLSIWGLPQSIVEIVGLHRRPMDAPESTFSTLSAVCAAIAIRNAKESNGMEENVREYLAAIQCEEKLEIWINESL